ncbi:MAG: hypothetical protein KDA67_14765 [Rhodobacteraceae bacterium]|nr:hypothetical protein [Paracoccaceae bacterium]
MTALKQFEKLESTALWRETLATQRREVIVSFGNASLVIRNNRDEPLSHWSLPAVERLNPGKSPALYAPNLDASETLEIEDQTMIEAIEKIRAAIQRRRPHPGRLRLAVFLGLSLAVVALLVFWLPGALERHTARVVPFETRQQIGREVLGQIMRLTGKACSSSLGDRALRNLERRLLDKRKGRIVILADGIAKSAHLPGGFILLNKVLLEDSEQAEIAGGYVLLEQLRADQRDPLRDLLANAGSRATFRLLTTGKIDDAALKSYAQYVLTAEAPMPQDPDLLARFSRAGFASSPLAYEIDISGETTLGLIEADPYLNKPYQPLLSDADWVSLQGICGD